VVSGGRQKISQKCKAVANSLTQLTNVSLSDR
jgi:hypothetical protein